MPGGFPHAFENIPAPICNWEGSIDTQGWSHVLEYNHTSKRQALPYLPPWNFLDISDN